MPMNYTSLTGAKGTSGALATWVGYGKLDVPVIVDEAQTLIYSFLRTREMRASANFFVAPGSANIALPTGFLDPIGRMYIAGQNRPIRHAPENAVFLRRNHTETRMGAFATNPFQVFIGQSVVQCTVPNHGFSQDSPFLIFGATSVGGINPNGSYQMTALVDANNFLIDTVTQTATSNATGGGAIATYTIENLTQGLPDFYGIWDEAIRFEFAFNDQYVLQLQYYRSLPLLSSANQTNFLTTRYPQLLRTATMAAAADFMKDDVEYQKGVARLQGLIQQVSIENDMSMRGMELDPIIP